MTEISSPAASTDPSSEAAQLAASVLEAEAEREAQQAAAQEPILFADDLLPGVGDEALTLRQGLAIGGTFTFVMLLLLNGVENLEAASLGVLAPDIRDSFGVSDGVIVFISAASSAFIVLGALPMGWLADRYRRPPIIGWAAAVSVSLVFVLRAGINAFTLFLARFGVGIASPPPFRVHRSLIADTYPIGVRGRLSATTSRTAC